MPRPEPRTSPPPAGAGPEAGVALVLGILFTIIVTGMVVSGSLVMRSHRANIETGFRLHGQALQFARAGLTEALGWFRKSKTQPVTQFAPVLDPGANPPVLETLEPDVGLVREFQISGQVWGRYEVWKKWDNDPDPVRLAWRQQVQVEDISVESGAAGAGAVWRLRSVGHVFRRVDPQVAFDQPPNQVLGTDLLGTEIRRMTLAPPGQAALCSRTGGATTIDNKVNLQGGTGAAVFYRAGTGNVTVLNGPTIVGNPGLSSSSSYDDSVEAVFGVGEKELQALADDRITVAASFPSPVAHNSLYHVAVPRLDFTAGLPLVGTAAVFVQGDVVFNAGSKSLFTGLLYVDGDLTVREPCEINGTIVCTGTVTVEGQNDWINLNYDDDALNSLRTAIGQYRLSAALRSVHSAE